MNEKELILVLVQFSYATYVIRKICLEHRLILTTILQVIEFCCADLSRGLHTEKTLSHDDS